ncbi:aminotransferase class I/II-fold pyridoxal phosphate-dependent enzyme [Rhizobacter sp. SG703]|uniref:aminotransferase class I/II-fold pyridoxal phosphate-dependent enzyme n=1 Tax=Rhizobacter sp. SG703 TaxID=2587140 RepID=UPI001444E911|nr:aminotransferase class I/II-fold pyridoxal phosphate-dependent enzyme [Rhizobacter sp. SG703]NKI97418.1 histidinol-phosphate aminotransferase [Rhizobacter sp. SG703]
MRMIHGGPDAHGVPRHDFSTNANACGPAPVDWRDADPTRYPDPSYTALRRGLAAFHGVDERRIVLAASASEFIARISTAVALRWPNAGVHLPRPSYGDYEAAALARGLREVVAGEARLVWHASPSSPFGRSMPLDPTLGAVHVVDRAYAPLNLQGDHTAPPDAAWQLWSPNKALGLTGIRGAYAIAPHDDDDIAAQLDALAPSWPLGAHAVLMLQAWASPAVQAWLQASLATLRRWKTRQLALCASLGWQCEPSDTPFYIARAPAIADRLPALRAHGIKLRDATSFGLPGAVRVSVQPPDAQDALARAWTEASR